MHFLIVTASISKLLHSWLFIDPSEHSYAAQTSKFNHFKNRSSTILNNVFKTKRNSLLILIMNKFLLDSEILNLTRSLREPGGPYTKSMEVSESCMERVESSMIHLQNIVGVLERNKVIVIWNDSLWWHAVNCCFHCHITTFDWQIKNCILKENLCWKPPTSVWQINTTTTTNKFF